MEHERIDTVKVDSDERGWQLVIETEDGERHLFPLPSGAQAQLVAETEKVREWLAEVADQRRIYEGAKLAGLTRPLDALEDVFGR